MKSENPLIDCKNCKKKMDKYRMWRGKYIQRDKIRVFCSITCFRDYANKFSHMPVMSKKREFNFNWEEIDNFRNGLKRIVGDYNKNFVEDYIKEISK